MINKTSEDIEGLEKVIDKVRYNSDDPRLILDAISLIKNELKELREELCHLETNLTG